MAAPHPGRDCVCCYDAVIERAHLVDDYEKVRTGALRNVTADIDMLGDALHALRAGSPHVTDEFVDRTLTRLRKTVDILRMDDSR